MLRAPILCHVFFFAAMLCLFSDPYFQYNFSSVTTNAATTTTTTTTTRNDKKKTFKYHLLNASLLVSTWHIFSFKPSPSEIV